MSDCTTNAPLNEYLQAVTSMRLHLLHGAAPPGPYMCAEDYVLKCGQPYESAPLTPEEQDYILEVVRRYRKRMPRRECYSNSQMILLLADFERRLTYVEGFALALIPLMHGWLDLNGKVIDVTLRHKPRRNRSALRDRVLGDWTDERQYHGVRLSTEYVRRKIVEREASGTLIDDWGQHWPLLTGAAVAHLPPPSQTAAST